MKKPMQVPRIPNIQLYIDEESNLCISRTRREAEGAALFISIPIADLMEGGEAVAGEKLGISILRHLSILYPDALKVEVGSRPPTDG